MEILKDYKVGKDQVSKIMKLAKVEGLLYDAVSALKKALKEYARDLQRLR